MLQTIGDDLKRLVSMYLFVKGIVSKTIVVSNKSKDEIIKQLEKEPKIIEIDGDYGYLLRMPIHSLTKEKLEELKKQIQDKKIDYKNVSETAIEDMWTSDLAELKKAL